MSTTAFDKFAIEYDRWFDVHLFAYQSEIEAIRRFIPKKGLGLEIGVGTGRFSTPFSVTIGVEPSEAMAAIARSRGISAHRARAEELPFEAEYFDFALMITTLCFVDNPVAALEEAQRVLKPAGRLILGIIDRDSRIGRVYQSLKASNKFYREATFYSTPEVLDLVRKAGFTQTQTCQTIFCNPDTMSAPDPVREGYGEGAFVVISSLKPWQRNPE